MGQQVCSGKPGWWLLWYQQLAAICLATATVTPCGPFHGHLQMTDVWPACQWISQMLGFKAYRLGVHTLYSHHGLYMEACASQNLARFFPDEPHGSHPHLLSGRLTWKGLRLRHCSSHEDQQPFTEVKSALRAVPVCPFMSRLGMSLCSASHDRQCMIIW